MLLTERRICRTAGRSKLFPSWHWETSDWSHRWPPAACHPPTPQFQHVRNEPPLLDLNMTSHTFAAEGQRLQQDAWSVPAATDWQLLPVGCLAANLPAHCCRWSETDGRTDGQMDARPLHRPCSAYYKGSINNGDSRSTHVAIDSERICPTAEGIVLWYMIWYVVRTYGTHTYINLFIEHQKLWGIQISLKSLFQTTYLSSMGPS